VTPEQEQTRIDAAVTDIDAELRAARDRLVAMILDGQEPREAVAVVMETFAGSMAATMREAFADILHSAAGSASGVPITVGPVSLSARLYAEAQATGEVVRGVVQRQASGFQDARKLALELFEGYGFRDPAAEPLVLAPTNERLPKYLREAVLAERDLQGELARAFARIQAGGLSTPALRAAYTELLDAIDGLEGGAGQRVLARKLDVAFYERMRYFATRIARTELHRAYAEREALLLLADVDVEFVQVRRAPGRQQPCICALFTGRDLYGLGPGVYPKAQSPVPGFHPFCMCVMSPRLDLTGRTATERDEGGDAYFLRRVGETTAGRIMGSQAKAGEVMQRSRTGEEVANASRNPAYRVRRAGEVVS
jgi:hypothetical protein